MGVAYEIQPCRKRDLISLPWANFVTSSEAFHIWDLQIIYRKTQIPGYLPPFLDGCSRTCHEAGMNQFRDLPVRVGLVRSILESTLVNENVWVGVGSVSLELAWWAWGSGGYLWHHMGPDYRSLLMMKLSNMLMAITYLWNACLLACSRTNSLYHTRSIHTHEKER